MTRNEDTVPRTTLADVRARAEAAAQEGSAKEPAIGDVVLGSFLLSEELARGSYATTYRALQMGTERDAVVKIAHRNLFEGPHAVKLRSRFNNEVRAMTRVSHPHLATVFTAGEVDNVPAIAMEYVPGTPLQDLLQESAPLSPRLIARLCSHIPAALHVVHRAGIVHCDVSPSNIIVSSDSAKREKCVLVDFGSAGLEGTSRATGAGLGLGTPRYMAPEAVSGRACMASDMYSLGAILWWAVTGDEFLGDISQVPAVLASQVGLQEPPDPRRVRRSIPEPMAKLIQQMLHPTPAKRPSATSFLETWPRIARAWVKALREDQVRLSPRPAIKPGSDALLSALGDSPRVLLVGNNGENSRKMIALLSRSGFEGTASHIDQSFEQLTRQRFQTLVICEDVGVTAAHRLLARIRSAPPSAHHVGRIVLVLSAPNRAWNSCGADEVVVLAESMAPLPASLTRFSGEFAVVHPEDPPGRAGEITSTTDIARRAIDRLPIWLDALEATHDSQESFRLAARIEGVAIILGADHLAELAAEVATVSHEQRSTAFRALRSATEAVVEGLRTAIWN